MDPTPRIELRTAEVVFIERMVLRIMCAPESTSDMVSLNDGSTSDERQAAASPDYHHVGGPPIVGTGLAPPVVGASGWGSAVSSDRAAATSSRSART
jgi:hypothetical protein